MKILITGAAGAVGSHVAERLANLGHEVVGIDSFTSYYDPRIKEINAHDIEHSGVKVFKRDLATDNLEDLLQGVDVVYHFAGQPGISAATPFDDYVRNNIIATHKLLEAAKKIQTLKIFVHISTSSIYGAVARGDETVEPKPTSLYGVTKLAAEQLALAAQRDGGLPVTVLRLFSVYGPRERPEKLYHKLIKAMLADEEFCIYEGAENHVRSYSSVSDIVDACALVLDHIGVAIGEIFNIGTDKTVTTGEGIQMIEKLMGKPARLAVVPKRQGDQKETGANIDKARRILGYNPKVNLEEGLRAEVEWVKEKIYGKISE